MGNIIPMGSRQLSRTFSREIPKYFTSDEIHRILSDELKEKHYTAWFLCEFLWNTGTRISEAVSVKSGDIDMRARVVRVRTLKRANHTRMIPLKPEFVGEVAVWLNENVISREDRLFQFNRKTAHYHVRKACEMAGINDNRAHPHTFRHSFAINCLIQGTPITVLKEWLGHRDIGSTLVYTQILGQDTRAFMDGVRF